MKCVITLFVCNIFMAMGVVHAQTNYAKQWRLDAYVDPTACSNCLTMVRNYFDKIPSGKCDKTMYIVADRLINAKTTIVLLRKLGYDAVFLSTDSAVSLGALSYPWLCLKEKGKMHCQGSAYSKKTIACIDCIVRPDALKSNVFVGKGNSGACETKKK